MVGAVVILLMFLKVLSLALKVFNKGRAMYVVITPSVFICQAF